MPVRSVLFVCSGNTCRSPMAEGIFRAEAAKRGLDIKVSSAGTGVTDSNVAANAVVAAGKLGADISRHTHRKLSAVGLERFDLILTMADRHLGAIPAPVRARAATLHAYAQDGEGDVSDPYKAELPVYRNTARELHKAIVKVLDRIQREPQP